MTSTLVPLSEVDCLGLLAMCRLGRIAVVDDGGVPLIFPISYRLVATGTGPVIAIRTRPDNVIDHVDAPVGFEIDGTDPGQAGGWSVLVRGVLRGVMPDDEIDPRPLATDQRDAWRVIVPTAITGRRLIADPERWTFNPAGYL